MRPNVEQDIFDAIAGIRDGALQLVESGVATRADIVKAMHLGCCMPRSLFDDYDDMADVKPISIDYQDVQLDKYNVLILGNGTMAQGIAEMIARRGCRVHIAGRHAGRVAAAHEKVRQSCYRGVSDSIEKQERVSRISSGTFHALAVMHWDLIIEACSENLEAKASAWRQVSTRLDAENLIATTTSSLRVAEVSRVFGADQQVFGLHFFNPAPVNPLVEIIAGDSPDLQQRALGIARLFNKTAVTCADSPGFIVNRLLIPYLNTCLAAFQSVEDVKEIDMLMVQRFKFPIGPSRLVDLIGADTICTIQWNLYRAFPEDLSPPSELVSSLVENGALGDKSNHGVMDYLKSNHRSGFYLDSHGL